MRQRAGGEGRGACCPEPPAEASHPETEIPGPRLTPPQLLLRPPQPTPTQFSCLNLVMQIPSGPLHLGPLEGVTILSFLFYLFHVSFLFWQNVVTGIDTNLYILMGRLFLNASLGEGVICYEEK